MQSSNLKSFIYPKHGDAILVLEYGLSIMFGIKYIYWKTRFKTIYYAINGLQ